jgi:cytochrome P450
LTTSTGVRTAVPPTMEPTAEWWRTVPGSFGWPLVGQSLSFYRDYLGLVRRAHAAWGPVFKMRILGQRQIMLVGAAANRLVLADQADSFSSRWGWEFSLGELFRNGLMLRDGDDHRYHRRILQVAFQRPALLSYLEQMEPLVMRALSSWPTGSELRVYRELKALLLDLAARVFLGVRLEHEIAAVNHAFQRVVKGSTAFVRRPVPGLDYARGLQGRRQLDAFFHTLVAARRQAPTEDVLGRLCTAVSEEGERLTDEQVVDHVIFFMMAAHDTTTSALTSLVYELGRHPSWQDRLRQECARHAEVASDERLKDLRELGWAIKETLRLHPPLVVIPRRAMAPVEAGGFTIPAGMNVTVSPAYTQRMEEYWSAPESFDPERFSEARAEDRKVPFAYLPFGGGVHLCLGMFFAEMQAKLIAHHLLRRFRWSLPEGYRAPYKQVPIQAPRDALPLRLLPA